MNKIRLFLALTLVAALLWGYGLRREGMVDESLFLHEVAPNVVFAPKKGFYYPSEAPPSEEAPENKKVAFNTYDVTPSIRGYAGPIKLLLALSAEGKIIGIKVLEHRETPNYVHRMETPEFLGQFLGKDVNDPFEVDGDIDGISRATVSVEALSDTVRESSRQVASSVLGIKIKETEVEKGGNGPRRQGGGNLKWAVYVALFLLSFAAYVFTRGARGSRSLSRGSRSLLKIRDVVLILSIVVVGLYLSSPFSILHVFNILLLRPSTDALWYAIVISTALSVIVAGRFYCGWLCPFGALSEFIGRVPLKKWDVPAEVDDRWRNLKYVLLGVVVLAVIPSGRVGFGNFETYVTLFSFHGTAFAWAVVAVSLAANLRVRRFWCRYLCPVAALTGVLSRKAPGYVSGKDCPVGNRPMPLISECIRCNRCYNTAKIF